jgi:GcrA cell cycle regulator
MSADKSAWTAERVELLKNHLEAGFSCSEIARQIGVSRNAVIGKIFRLKLSRPQNARANPTPRERGATGRRPRTVFGQRRILMALYAEPQPAAGEVAIANGQRCSLLELSQEKCRWPISNPGAADFWFCGNKPVKGLPYCAGHARIAYQPAVRQRAARP